MKKILFLVISLQLLTGFMLNAQMPLPYILNGSATQRSCNCYVLTPDQQSSSGTVWNKNKINLNQDFDYAFDVNLGCKDITGADGIGFILQTKGTNLGGLGSGLGFQGISPSLGVLIDTYQNLETNDPTYDHLAIQMNGLLDHKSSSNLAGPVTVIKNKDNVEDCLWHLFRIKWNAALKHMEVSVDKQLRLTLDKDLVKDIFGGDPYVFWGFAGSTGGASNKQQFCAALRPEFSFNPQQSFCEGASIQFNEQSTSFGAITKWWWGFGDGTFSAAPIPPAHIYLKAGNYEVKLVIEDNSGCKSDTLKVPLTVGTSPVVDFGPDHVCLGAPVYMNDHTSITTGTLQKWEWTWDNGTTSMGVKPMLPYTTPGSRQVQLKVTSAQGCASSSVKSILIGSTPQVSGSIENVCLGTTTYLRGINHTPDAPIKKWQWELGNGEIQLQQNAAYNYTDPGYYPARLYAISEADCQSPVIDVPVRIYAVHADAGRDTIVDSGHPFQLQSGWGDSRLQYTWSPAIGLSNPDIPDPIAILYKSQTYHLTLTSPEGCHDEDDINIKVNEGPAFFVPNAFTPNNDGRNDIFRVILAGQPKLDFFCIWNRWGQEIFRTTDPQNGWDGNCNGRPASTGTYVWMVQGVDYMGQRFSRKGTITLIR
ncbi:lectin-like domain-containing protein [Chitinophaga sp. RAB17]|uniref:lectin-like domain-containing protein n=1 Tax=Chitinophaga sp. RAB17 TaxID=3233049 RepID=UPI003F8E8BA1